MSDDKIKVRRHEYLLLQLLGFPVLRMITGMFKRFAAQTKNEYDDEAAKFLEGLLAYLSTEDLFEIT